MDKSHIIGYCLLAFCFVVAYFLGNELNPKVKPKTTPASDVSGKGGGRPK
ncbi:MAG: hypothetical protein P4L53_23730 [Candidatus Obscuribacterales bacterium]|nr:hypothetical protein [Candidatus Obscuribacterales bacterium]